MNRPGSGGGAEATGEWSSASTQEVPERAAEADVDAVGVATVSAIEAEPHGPMSVEPGGGLHPRKQPSRWSDQMTRPRIHNLSMSLDGFATGEGQALEAPFGHAGHRLVEWMFATRFGAPIWDARAAPSA